MERDLPALREWWGDAYQIDWDFRTRTFRAVRRDNGAMLEHSSADALWDLIFEDCRAEPVVMHQM